VNREEIRQVWLRAQSRCEYCHLFSSDHPLPFHVDHIIARQHGGQTVLDNLALSCLHCNRHKGPNIAGIDSATGNSFDCSILGWIAGPIISNGHEPH
jgi:hypothetical protein